jgi:hypothetical protein
MNPPVSGFYAFLTDMLIGRPDLDLVEVRTLAFHDSLPAISNSGSSDLGQRAKGHIMTQLT